MELRNMMLNQINLTEFKPPYRQALLFSMIEGLNEGGAFTFIDSRSSEEIESELGAAGLIGYCWTVQEATPDIVTVVVKKG